MKTITTATLVILSLAGVLLTSPVHASSVKSSGHVHPLTGCSYRQVSSTSKHGVVGGVSYTLYVQLNGDYDGSGTWCGDVQTYGQVSAGANFPYNYQAIVDITADNHNICSFVIPVNVGPTTPNCTPAASTATGTNGYAIGGVNIYNGTSLYDGVSLSYTF